MGRKLQKIDHMALTDAGKIEPFANQIVQDCYLIEFDVDVDDVELKIIRLDLVDHDLILIFSQC